MLVVPMVDTLNVFIEQSLRLAKLKTVLTAFRPNVNSSLVSYTIVASCIIGLDL